MGSGLLLETISVWRDPSKCRPPHLLRWNPLLQPPQPQFLVVGARKPIGFLLRCTPRMLSATAEKKKNSSPGPALRFVIDTLDRFKKPAAAIVLLGFLLTVDPCGTLAASGGRMGGTAFSSSSSRSHSSSSWSSSAPPVSSFSYSAPYYAPAPFGGGLYVGPAFGVGSGLGSGFSLFMMGFVAVILLSGFLPDRADDGSVLTATQRTSVIKLQVWPLLTCFFFMVGSFVVDLYDHWTNGHTTTLVGLLDTARSFQKDLDQIAEAADTSTAEGLNYILTETTLALLRHPDCCISAYYSVTILVAAEGGYKLPVINGSGELKEALQKLGSIPSSKTLVLRSIHDIFLIIVMKKPLISHHYHNFDLCCMQAVEVLWTPQDENDTLSERELLEDYPLLRPL
ncbi:hypothetical protein BHE74_00041366 [Ensete ventricosum]|nr:hypothetical protein BHE74_00041366 [Ensete ventricosum]